MIDTFGTLDFSAIRVWELFKVCKRSRDKRFSSIISTSSIAMSIFLVIWGQWPHWLQQSRVFQVNILKSTRSECSCHCFTRDLTFFEKNQNLRQKNLRLREKIPKTRPMRKIHANQSFIRRNQFFQWKSSYRTSATVVRHFPIVFDHWHWHYQAFSLTLT